MLASSFGDKRLVLLAEPGRHSEGSPRDGLPAGPEARFAATCCDGNPCGGVASNTDTSIMTWWFGPRLKTTTRLVCGVQLASNPTHTQTQVAAERNSGDLPADAEKLPIVSPSFHQGADHREVVAQNQVAEVMLASVPPETPHAPS